MNDPLVLLLLLGAAAYTIRAWYNDLQATRGARPAPNPLPGATPAPTRAVIIAVAGAVVLLLVETVGEIKLGIAAQQSRMTWLFALYSIAAAPVIEELIFRGWLVFEKRGHVVLWAGAVAASAGFALLHPFLWQWDNRGFMLTLNGKGWFSSGAVFALSLWLYVSRLAPWNPHRSLLPCFVAHAAKNTGVVAIKAATGFMSTLW